MRYMDGWHASAIPFKTDVSQHEKKQEKKNESF